MDGEMKGEYGNDAVLNGPEGEEWQRRWEMDERGKQTRVQLHLCDSNVWSEMGLDFPAFTFPIWSVVIMCKNRDPAVLAPT